MELVRVVWRRKGTVATFVAAALAMGCAYLWLAPSRFRASTQLVVEQAAAVPGEHVRFEPTFVSTQAVVLRSRKIVEEALQEFMPREVAAAEDPLAFATNVIRVTPVEETEVMEISYVCGDSREAVRMLECLVAAYEQHVANSSADTQLQSLALLTEAEEGVRSQLEEKQAQYRELRKNSELIGIGPDAGRLRTQYLASLSNALNEARNRRLRLQKQLAASGLERLVTEEPAASAPQVVSAAYESLPPGRHMTAKPTFDSLSVVGSEASRAEILKLEEQLYLARQREAKLDAQYGDKHPDLRAIRGEVDSLEQRLTAKAIATPSILNQELEIAEQEEQGLVEIYDKEAERARLLDLQQLEESQLIEGIERVQAVHDSILAEMHARQLASQSAAGGQGSVRVTTIAAPKSNGKPVWPLPSVVLALCGAAGLASGATAGVLMESLAYRRRDRFANRQAVG